MSINKMLIDATHPEETRVVVLRQGRVEEFDFESAARKLLRGNIYLAKVTRVEPSLQAAFIDYGGNRHGFLAFNEIHPDYYQIPVADRQALLEEEAAQEAAEEAEVDAHAERLARRREQRQRDPQPAHGEAASLDHDHSDHDPIDHNDHNDVETVGEHTGGDGHFEPHRHDADASAAGDGDGASSGSERRTMAADVAQVEQIIADTPPPVTVGGFDPVHDAPAFDAAGHEPARHDDHAHHDHDHGHDHAHDDAGAHERRTASPLPVAADLIEPAGTDDVVEEMPQRPRRRPRSYKIQEVIKRRQVILVQVVKEERGNKGAALTTYLSLAGRYTVLMPNTARGGGISRKITQPQDRKRLKAIANELEVPEGMGLIIRTAGASRTSQEIKRDFEYLLRLWESVRELTLASTAPSLVYEEGNLIKRSIRDLYNKDVDEVVVAGEVAHREARDFMRMLMPSHAQNVIEYKGAEPLFTRFRMEQQLAAMFSPTVTLKSGGYIVINQTEALVAIDVNSGKSTREYSIEETALNTNLEAAEEIARQLKLRDLAGLIVIDFIDMEEKRNNRSVERRLKDALRFDRARIQLGRISHFGLMEMSRQRLRTGVLEGSTSQCPHCQGTGIIRSIESIALAVIRGLEDALMSGTRMALIATTTPQVALYILNAKRAYITDMEARHGLAITVQGSEKLQGANFTVEKVVAALSESPLRRRSSSAVNMEWGFEGEADEEAAPEAVVEAIGYDEPEERGSSPDSDARTEDGPGGEEGRRRRRRRGRRGRRDERPGSETQGGDRQSGTRSTFANDDSYVEDSRDDNQIVEVDRDDQEPELIGGEEGAGDDRDGGDAQPRARGPGEAPETEGEARARRGRRRGRRGGRRGGQNRERAPFAANDQNGGVIGDGVIGEGGDFDGPAERAGGEQWDTGERGPGGHDIPAQTEASHERHATSHETGEAARTPAVAHDQTAHERVSTSQPTERTPRRSREPVVDAVTEAPAAAAPIPAPQPQRTAAVERQAEAPAPVAAPSSAATPAAEPAKPRRSSSSSSEPIVERVVVTPEAGTAAAPAAETEAKPVRKGWWQRKLGID